jgi:hypothetical protein
MMFAEIALERLQVLDGVILTPLVSLWVRTRYDDYIKIKFLLDSGADMAAMPVVRARREAISFREIRPGHAHGVGGPARSYIDTLQVMIAGEPFAWPCSFYETTPDHEPFPVMGRRGFFEVFDFCLGARTCRITRRGSRWAWLTGLWPWRRLWQPDEPL